MITIKQKLNELWKKSGYSLAELEQTTGIAHSTMRRLLDINDESMPTFDNVINVVIALGGSIDELIGAKVSGTTETPLTQAYKQLLEEKDRIIAEKDDHIHRLQDASRTQRKEKYILAAVLLAILLTIMVVLIIDIINRNMGYVRY